MTFLIGAVFGKIINNNNIEKLNPKIFTVDGGSPRRDFKRFLVVIINGNGGSLSAD